MKTSMTIQELLLEVNRQTQAKRDFVTSTESSARLVLVEGRLIMELIVNRGGSLERFEVSAEAHDQIASRLRIPTKYYGRLVKDHPDLIIQQVNTLFEREPETRMFRVLDGEVRAFLSDRYLRIDHDEVLENSLPSIIKGEIKTELMSSHVSRSRMDLKVLFTDERLSHEISNVGGKPRIIRPGFRLSNSETGGGSFRIDGFFYDSYCTNGCVWGLDEVFNFSRRHLGKKIDSLNVESQRTRDLEAKLIVSQTQDAIFALSDFGNVRRMAEALREKANTAPAQSPIKTIELAAKDFGLSEREKESAMSTFLRDQDFTQWGLASAVTEIANNTAEYSRANVLEEMGGLILDLKPSQWKRLVQAETIAA